MSDQPKPKLPRLRVSPPKPAAAVSAVRSLREPAGPGLPAPRYEPLEPLDPLGSHGKATSCQAWDPREQRRVALKRWQDLDEDATDDLLARAEQLSHIDHPNISKVLDYGRDSEGPFVASRLASGETFTQIAALGELAWEDSLEMIEPVLTGLQALHGHGLLHLSLKPSGVVLDWNEANEFTVLLLNAGLGRPASPWQAPEQAAGAAVDGRTDLYSLGCLVYHLLTNRLPHVPEAEDDAPFSHEPCGQLHSLRKDLPAGLIDWVHWLTRPEPADRPVNAAAALLALRALRATVAAIPAASLPLVPAPTASQIADLMALRDTSPVLSLPLQGRWRLIASLSLAVFSAAVWGVIDWPGQPRATSEDLLSIAGGPPPASAATPAPALESAATLATLLSGSPVTAPEPSRPASDPLPLPEDMPRADSPPGHGLVLWLDAASGPSAGPATAPLPADAIVEHWHSRLTGPFALTALLPSPDRTVSLDALPHLSLYHSEHGLRGEHPVVTFAGGNGLDLLPASSTAEIAPAGSFPDHDLSAVLLVRLASREPAALLTAGFGEGQPAFSLSYSENRLFAGLHTGADTPPAGAALHTWPGHFAIVSVLWSGSTGSVRLFFRNAEGGAMASISTLPALWPDAPLQSLRLGGQSEEIPFNGALAQALVYRRVLTSAERLQAESALYERYFRDSARTLATAGK